MTTNRSLLLFGLALLGGCAQTHIHVDDPQVDLYVDGELLARGQADVKQIGFPSSMLIEAKKGRHLLKDTLVSRSIKLETVGFACISYGTAFLWGWMYPGDIRIEVPYAGAGNGKITPIVDPWNISPLKSEDKWARPINAASPIQPVVPSAAAAVNSSEPAPAVHRVVLPNLDSIPVADLADTSPFAPDPVVPSVAPAVEQQLGITATPVHAADKWDQPLPSGQ